MYDLAMDSRQCRATGHHLARTRHTREECPAMTEAKLTAREVKNKILSSLPEDEREDAIVGETHYGGYLIVTDYKVIEVVAGDGDIYAQSRAFSLSGDGWEDYDY